MKIGLLGHCIQTGVGNLTRDLWGTGVLERWLVPRNTDYQRHGVTGIAEDMLPDSPAVIPCHAHWTWEPEARHFLAGLDWVVFAESPALGAPFVALCRELGVRTCCIPMMEWFPNHLSDWSPFVDAVWGPTRWSVAELHKRAADMAARERPALWAGNILGGRWGVSLEAFRFRRRSKCRTFLFVNGWGGIDCRKGIRELAEAAELVPDVTILVRSQSKSIPKLTANMRLVVSDERDRQRLYEAGDVLLAPSRWEGLGLQLYEAQACGVPVVTTDAPPMNECNPIAAAAADAGWVSLAGNRVETWSARADDLAGIIRGLAGQDIGEASDAARAFIEFDHDLRDVAAELVRALENLPDAA